MNTELHRYDALQELPFAERWEEIITASVRASRAHLTTSLAKISAEPEDNSMKVRSLARQGRRMVAQVMEHPDVVQERLRGKSARILVQEKKKPVDNTDKYDTSQLTSMSFSNAGVSVQDVKHRQQDHYPYQEYADVMLQIEEGQKLKGADPAQSDITIYPISDEDPKRLKSELKLVSRFSEGEGLTVPARFIKNGNFPIPSTEGLKAKEGLDDAQNRAYGMAMEYDKCPVLFLHGGPGTGKTSTICNIVEGHIAQGRKVLVLSHSNKGAQVPAERLHDKGVQVYIAGNNPNMVMEKLRSRRIKYQSNYPEEQIKEVKRMSDTEIVSKYLKKTDAIDLLDGKKGQLKLKKKVQKWRKERIELIIERYEQKLLQREGKYKNEIKDGGVTFSTLGTLMNDSVLASVKFDVVIVDEATRLRTPDLVLALQNAGKQIIFVGDPLQLGNIPLSPKEENDLEYMMAPTITPAQSSSEGLVPTISNLSRYSAHYNDTLRSTRTELDSEYDDVANAKQAVAIYEDGPFAAPILASKDPEKEMPYVFLNEDRRSLPAIVKVLSELIYDGKLKAGREADEVLGEGVVKWVDTSKMVAEKAKSDRQNSGEKTVGTSRRNPLEVQLIVGKVLEALFKDKIQPEELAVIATYGSQAKAIREKLGKYSVFRKDEEGRKLYERICSQISTVDAFQGDERKKVFVSLTRSNQEGKIGFLEEERRIGVAIGRAQEELIIFGDMSTVIDKNDNPESRAFFTKMRDLIAQNGSTVSEEQGHRRRRRRGGHGRSKREKREYLRLKAEKLAAHKTDSHVSNSGTRKQSRLVNVSPEFAVRSDLVGDDDENW